MFLSAFDIFWVDVVKISFYEIPADGLSLSVDNDHWFPDDLDLKKYDDATLFLKRYEQRVIVKGSLSVVVALNCDRCLDTFDLPVQSEFEIDLELANNSDVQDIDADHHCHDSEMDIVVLSEDEIDVYHILQQQIYLALPLKKLCSEQCNGVCLMCGANLNRNKCECKQDSKSPFSVLANLQK